MRSLKLIRGMLWGIGILAVVAGTAIWLGQPDVTRCAVCERPIHANMHAVALVDGEQMDVCCPRCALTLQIQDGKQVRLLEVSDFHSARALRPERAFYIEGSDVEVCSPPRLRRSAERTTPERKFDRCAPSLLAFADEREARAFITQHRGTLQRLEDLMR